MAGSQKITGGGLVTSAGAQASGVAQQQSAGNQTPLQGDVPQVPSHQVAQDRFIPSTRYTHMNPNWFDSQTAQNQGVIFLNDGREDHKFIVFEDETARVAGLVLKGTTLPNIRGSFSGGELFFSGVYDKEVQEVLFGSEGMKLHFSSWFKPDLEIELINFINEALRRPDRRVQVSADLWKQFILRFSQRHLFNVLTKRGVPLGQRPDVVAWIRGFTIQGQPISNEYDPPSEKRLLTIARPRMQPVQTSNERGGLWQRLTKKVRNLFGDDSENGKLKEDPLPASNQTEPASVTDSTLQVASPDPETKESQMDGPVQGGSFSGPDVHPIIPGLTEGHPRVLFVNDYKPGSPTRRFTYIKLDNTTGVDKLSHAMIGFDPKNPDGFNVVTFPSFEPVWGMIDKILERPGKTMSPEETMRFSSILFRVPLRRLQAGEVITSESGNYKVWLEEEGFLNVEVDPLHPLNRAIAALWNSFKHMRLTLDGFPFRIVRVPYTRPWFESLAESGGVLEVGYHRAVLLRDPGQKEKAGVLFLKGDEWKLALIDVKSDVGRRVVSYFAALRKQGGAVASVSTQLEDDIHALAKEARLLEKLNHKINGEILRINSGRQYYFQAPTFHPTSAAVSSHGLKAAEKPALENKADQKSQKVTGRPGADEGFVDAPPSASAQAYKLIKPHSVLKEAQYKGALLVSAERYEEVGFLFRKNGQWHISLIDIEEGLGRERVLPAGNDFKRKGDLVFSSWRPEDMSRLEQKALPISRFSHKIDGDILKVTIKGMRYRFRTAVADVPQDPPSQPASGSSLEPNPAPIIQTLGTPVPDASVSETSVIPQETPQAIADASEVHPVPEAHPKPSAPAHPPSDPWVGPFGKKILSLEWFEALEREKSDRLHHLRNIFDDSTLPALIFTHDSDFEDWYVFKRKGLVWVVSASKFEEGSFRVKNGIKTQVSGGILLLPTDNALVEDTYLIVDKDIQAIKNWLKKKWQWSNPSQRLQALQDIADEHLGSRKRRAITFSSPEDFYVSRPHYWARNLLHLFCDNHADFHAIEFSVPKAWRFAADLSQGSRFDVSFNMEGSEPVLSDQERGFAWPSPDRVYQVEPFEMAAHANRLFSGGPLTLLPVEESLFEQATGESRRQVMNFRSPEGILMQIPMVWIESRTTYLQDLDLFSNGVRILFPDPQKEGFYQEVKNFGLAGNKADTDSSGKGGGGAIQDLPLAIGAVIAYGSFSGRGIIGFLMTLKEEVITSSALREMGRLLQSCIEFFGLNQAPHLHSLPGQGEFSLLNDGRVLGLAAKKGEGDTLMMHGAQTVFDDYTGEPLPQFNVYRNKRTFLEGSGLSEEWLAFKASPEGSLRHVLDGRNNQVYNLRVRRNGQIQMWKRPKRIKDYPAYKAGSPTLSAVAAVNPAGLAFVTGVKN